MQITRRTTIAGGLAALAAAIAPTARAAADWSPPEPDRELRVKVRGGSIYVRVNGPLDARAAPALFIHGGPGSGHAYFLPALQMADRRAIILYDSLDAGLSDRPGDPANWTVERFVSEVDAIRAALDLDRLHLVGQSWGGTVALEYGARVPGGLRSLTLSSPLVSTRSWEASTRAQLATLPEDVQAVINSHEVAGTTGDPAYAAAMDIFYAHFLARHRPPAYVTAYRERTGIRLNPLVYNAMWGPGEIRATGSLRDYDGEPLLPRLSVPVLAIAGDHDEMTPDALRPLVARIPEGRLAIIADSGHSTFGDQPAQVIALLRDHFGQTD